MLGTVTQSDIHESSLKCWNVGTKSAWELSWNPRRRPLNSQRLYCVQSASIPDAEYAMPWTEMYSNCNLHLETRVKFNIQCHFHSHYFIAYCLQSSSQLSPNHLTSLNTNFGRWVKSSKISILLFAADIFNPIFSELALSYDTQCGKLKNAIVRT